MRILFVQRHFWPDAPTYAHLTKEIAVHLASDGHDVSVFSAVPSYNAAYSGDEPALHESVDGVSVRRVRIPSNDGKRLRQQLWDAALFLSRVSGHLLRQRIAYDAIVVTNAPPVFLAALIRFVTRLTGTPYVYHCQDLQPEVGVISGRIPKGPISHFLLRLDKANCERAAAVVVLSADMRDTLVDRGLSGHNVHMINNFIVEPAKRDTTGPAQTESRPGPFRVVFAGNMGRFQGLDRAIDAARVLADRRDIQFTFMGSGTEVESLKRLAGPLMRATVAFMPHQPFDKAMATLAESQLGLVPLQPAIYRVAYPSKIMAYAEAGCRLLLLMECNSEAATTVERFDIGSCCEASDPRSIANAVLAEYDRFRKRGENRQHVRTVARRLFGKEDVLQEWSALFELLQRTIVTASHAEQATTPEDTAPNIRIATSEDLDQVVAVHSAAFPGFTMTRLGSRFLQKYYEMVLGYAGHLFLVAEGQDSEIVGFVVGFRDPGRFYAEFRKRRWKLGVAAIPNVVRRPLLVRDMRGGSQWASDQQGLEESDLCELASIGVKQNAAGSGIGSRLVRQFTTRAFAAGATSVTLTTDADDNERVRGFYSHLGFQATGDLRRGADRHMVEYRLYPHSRDA